MTTTPPTAPDPAGKPVAAKPPAARPARPDGLAGMLPGGRRALSEEERREHIRAATVYGLASGVLFAIALYFLMGGGAALSGALILFPAFVLGGISFRLLQIAG